MSGPSGNHLVFFPRIRLGKHQDSRKTSENLMSNLLFTVHQHGGDDVT